jgi:type 1 glutamine amidotransferase
MVAHAEGVSRWSGKFHDTRQSFMILAKVSGSSSGKFLPAMQRILSGYLTAAFMLIISFSGFSEMQKQEPAFHVLVLSERGGIHEGFVVAALDWLKDFSAEQHFQYDVINNTDSISETFLSHYQVFLQLNYPPYMWTDRAKAAFINYMEQGRGGWVGLHHASLLGEFDGYAMWDWFSEFMGGIRWKNYIAARATATVHIEDKNHPVMKGLPETFSIPDDEWYTYDKDPRPRVHVIANVDESSYQPPSDIKMGDHPVIWSNEKIKARNIYFQMGHHANIFHSPEFNKMFGNAILWAAGR